MSNQEEKFFQELQEEESICKSMLHLSTAAHHHPTTATTSASPNNSTKRHSPSSFQEPLCKRATLNSPSSPSAAADYRRLGFTKLPLPCTASPPPLRRTFSEPIHSTESPGPVLNQESSGRNIVDEPGTFQNAPPFIQRTVSDPSPVANRQVVALGGTPPRPPQTRSVSRCGLESPSSKCSSVQRLQRMKERMREMNKWWNEVVREDEDEEDTEYQNHTSDITRQEDSKLENQSQEAVWVEKNGECVVLHFKCPCGDGYQILLSGNNLYYRLTNL